MRKSFSLMICSLLLILEVGCKKPVSDNEGNEGKAKKLFDVSSTNPYDSIGLMHNACMDYFASHANFTTYATASNGAFSIVENYLRSQNQDTAGMYALFKDTAFQTIFGGNCGSDSSKVVTVLNNGMSSAVYYYHLMNSAFTTGMSGTFSESDSLNQFQVNLGLIQSSVNSDVSLTSNEKRVLLVGLDVADRSANYWQNQQQLGQAGSFLSNLWNKITHPFHWVWQETVEMDYNGAILGAAIWSIVGNPLAGALVQGAVWSIIDVLIQVFGP